jgi:hypothetical protein
MISRNVVNVLTCEKRRGEHPYERLCIRDEYCHEAIATQLFGAYTSLAFGYLC